MPGCGSRRWRSAGAFFTKATETHRRGYAAPYQGADSSRSAQSPNSLYFARYRSFTMGAEYDQKDARGFNQPHGLPMQVRASLKLSKKGEEEMKLWGGRFEEGPSEVFERFSGSLHLDRRLIHAISRDRRRSRGRVESVGILTAMKGPNWSPRSTKLDAEAEKPEFYEGATDESLHTLVIRKLNQKVGALSEKSIRAQPQ